MTHSKCLSNVTQSPGRFKKNISTIDMTLHAVMIQLEDYRTYSFKTCDAATQRIDQPIRRRLITKREYKE